MAPHAAPRTSFCRGWVSEIAPPLLCYSFFVVHSSSSDEAPRGCHPERAHVVRERGTCLSGSAWDLPFAPALDLLFAGSVGFYCRASDGSTYLLVPRF